jgi:hypothetical protein
LYLQISCLRILTNANPSQAKSFPVTWHAKTSNSGSCLSRQSTQSAGCYKVPEHIRPKKRSTLNVNYSRV